MRFGNRRALWLTLLPASVLAIAVWCEAVSSRVQQFSPSAPAASHVNGRISFTNDNLIHSINADGSDDKVLSTASGLSGYSDHYSVWSADGTKIAFSRRPFTGGPAAIWVMDADGMNQRQISLTAAGDSQPTWSPDGTKIAFGRQGVNKGDIRRPAR